MPPVTPPVVSPTVPPAPTPVDSGNSETAGESGGGSSVPGHNYAINCAWGQHQVLNFNPDADTLDFGWAFEAGQLSLTESNGSTVLGIPSNSQSYILNGVSLDELSTANFVSKDSGVMSYFTSVLDADTLVTVQLVGLTSDPGLYV